MFVPGVRAGQVYGYRIDRGGVLLDPYGRGVAVPAGYRRETGPPDPLFLGRAFKSVLVDTDGYDWEGDRPLGRPLRESVIYEAHVRGMTANPNSGVTAGERGTYRGLISRIPYLTGLGISAVELLPVHHFDALAAPAGPSATRPTGRPVAMAATTIAAGIVASMAPPTIPWWSVYVAARSATSWP